MRLDEALADREAEPGASGEAGALVEEVREPVGRDPPPLVRDGERDVAALARRLDPDRGGRGSVAGRVREEVVHHLHDALRVGHRTRQVRRQVDEDGMPASAAQEGAAGPVHQRGDVRGLGAAGPGSGDRIDAELGYALPVGSRLVGTPRFGVTTSEYGRDYRLGYSLGCRAGWRHELPVRPRRPAPREPASGQAGPQPGGPTHSGLVGAGGQVVVCPADLGVLASVVLRAMAVPHTVGRAALWRARPQARFDPAVETSHGSLWCQLLVAAARTGRPADIDVHALWCSPSPRPAGRPSTHWKHPPRRHPVALGHAPQCISGSSHAGSRPQLP